MGPPGTFPPGRPNPATSPVPTGSAAEAMPIVIASAADPVGSGLVAGLGRPGGNVTGLSMIAGSEIAGKYLELLREAVPRVSRIGVITNPDNRALVPQVKE